MHPQSSDSEKRTERGWKILEQSVCPMKNLFSELVADHETS